MQGKMNIIINSSYNIQKKTKNIKNEIARLSVPKLNDVSKGYKNLIIETEPKTKFEIPVELMKTLQLRKQIH